MRVLGLALVTACGRIDFERAGTCASHGAALFCEDFESGIARWQRFQPVVQSQIARGLGHAARSQIQAAPAIDVAELPLPIAGTAELDLRFWYYAPAGLSYDHINLAGLAAANGEGISVYVSANRLSVYYNTPQQGDLYGPALALDRWQCVELALGVAESGGTVTLSVDDVLAFTQGTLDTRPTGDYDRLDAGIPFSGLEQLGPATIYEDDMVVDVSLIGCAP